MNIMVEWSYSGGTELKTGLGIRLSRLVTVVIRLSRHRPLQQRTLPTTSFAIRHQYNLTVWRYIASPVTSLHRP